MKTIKKVSVLVITLLLIMQWIPMINAGADGTASADPSTMSLSRLPEGPSGPRQPGDVPEEVEAASAEKAPTSEDVEIAPARQDLSEEVRERDPASVPGNDPEADTPENLPVPEELLADAVPTEPGSTKPTIPVKGSLNWNVSESPVQSNADNGPLPNASTVFVWHSYYFNLQVTGDIQLKSCKLYVKPSGSSSYTVADDYTAGGYFRYRAVSYYFETAGSFSYYWYVTYYEGGSQTLTTTTITVNDLYYITMSQQSGDCTYDGNPHSISISVSGPSSYTIYYSTTTQLTSSNYSSAGSTTKPSRTAAGGFNTYWYIKDNTGYYYDKYGNCWTFIYPAVTANAYEGTYDGSSHKPTISTSGGATLYYSKTTELDLDNYTSSGTTTVPTRTNSGGTRVYFIAVANTGEICGKRGYVWINIDPKVTASGYSGAYDGSSHKPTVSATGNATLYYSTSGALTYDNYAASGSTTLPSRTAAGTTTVYYIAIPNSDANENTWTKGSTTITINKATTSTSTSGYSGTYDGSSHSPTVTVSGPSSYTIYYSTSTSLTSSNYSSSGSTTKPTRTNSGDSTVYFYVKDGTGNYSDKSGSTYIRIKPKVTATAWSGTYDGSSHKPTMSATGSATLYYSTSTALTYSNYSSSGSTTLPSRTAEGTTTVYYIAVPNSNPSADTCTTGSTKIEILQHTHNYTYTVSSAPTVSATGTLSGVCSICEGTTTVTLPKLNTTDYSYKSIKAATCTATGTGRYTWKTTTYGSYYFDVILNATGHSYNSVVTAPTCTAQGYTTYTCIHGDSQYVSDYTDPTGHTWNGGVVTQQPTETSSGVKTYTCLVCGATRNEVIPPAEHVHHYVETVTPPKCTEQGYSTFRCSCGSTYQDKYVAATGHSYAYTIAAEPSVVASGRLKGTCTKCSAETSVVLPNLNEDDYTRTVTVPATCTTGGTQRFTWNETAYGEYFLDLPIYPLGHDYVQGVCNRCGCLQSDPDAKLPFTDVKEGAYYYNAVRWAVNRGIATGTSATTFGTKSSCTRAQVMTFLWNAAGQPEPTSTANPFTDVKPTAYYYKPVLWAVERGIATGTTPSTFGPKGTCTRAQIVTFLWNYCGSPEPVTTQNPYTDVKPSSYYYKAVLWAYENEITTGTSLTTFGPKSICNRAQVVTFIWNALT